ncbi:hypothetical protein J6590_061862 [Homalodisca vitripennis]|nr:hypothetical protein J6590_061862 [Homalodisca vitripennis]
MPPLRGCSLCSGAHASLMSPLTPSAPQPPPPQYHIYLPVEKARRLPRTFVHKRLPSLYVSFAPNVRVGDGIKRYMDASVDYNWLKHVKSIKDPEAQNLRPICAGQVMKTFQMKQFKEPRAEWVDAMRRAAAAAGQFLSASRRLMLAALDISGDLSAPLSHLDTEKRLMESLLRCQLVILSVICDAK